MDVNQELKFFVKIQKKNFFGGGGVGSGGVGVRWEGRGRVGGVGGSGGGGGGSGWWGEARVCERIIEFFVKIQKKNFLGGGGWSEGSG